MGRPRTQRAEDSLTVTQQVMMEPALSVCWPVHYAGLCLWVPVIFNGFFVCVRITSSAVRCLSRVVEGALNYLRGLGLG